MDVCCKCSKDSQVILVTGLKYGFVKWYALVNLQNVGKSTDIVTAKCLVALVGNTYFNVDLIDCQYISTMLMMNYDSFFFVKISLLRITTDSRLLGISTTYDLKET